MGRAFHLGGILLLPEGKNLEVQGPICEQEKDANLLIDNQAKDTGHWGCRFDFLIF